MAKEKREPFKYKKRSEDSFQRQAERSSGSWDKLFKDSFKEFKPKEGDHRIRILPPTFEGAEHYAMSLWVHSNVGPDRQTYLCLQKMQQEPCPVCEEHRRAQKEGDEKYADELRSYERRLAWVIDRANESDGPLLYNMPFSKMDKRICAVAKDQETGETLWLDDPDEGYDVFFRREGSQLKTDYTGHAPARRPSPISKDEDTQAEWLSFIQKHPLDTVLQFYSYQHINAAFSGAVAKKEADEDPEPDVRHSKDRKDFADRVDRRGGKGKEIDEDDEEAEAEEDEEPAPKSAKKPKPTPADDDDDVEDEEPPPSKKSRAVVDDDDEDVPAPKAAARPAKRSVEEDEAEVDEDDEPRPSRRRGR